MTEATRAQFLKQIVKVMTINMSLMPPKVIGEKTCLWAKGPSRLSKKIGSNRCPNIWKEKSRN